MQRAPQTRRDPAEGSFLATELANGITHGVGLLASAVGLVLLVVFSSRNGDGWVVVACSVYGTTLVLLYLASTLYHSIWPSRARRVFQAIDHAAIYLLIAGTYTPFTLVPLRGPWGWSLFGVVWGVALLGVLYKIFFIGRFRVASALIYLLLGWMALVAIKPLLVALPAGAIFWLVAGGVAYTVGVFFYAYKPFRYHHAVWHLFVMLGSTCHFFAVMFYVVPG